MLQMFRELAADHFDITDDQIDALVDVFMDATPDLSKLKLQAAQTIEH